MLADVLEASAAMAADAELDAVLAVDARATACAELARECPPAFRVVAQRGADLGARMEWAVAEAAAGGASADPAARQRQPRARSGSDRRGRARRWRHAISCSRPIAAAATAWSHCGDRRPASSPIR